MSIPGRLRARQLKLILCSISSENVAAALTTEVSELKNLMKTMLIDKQKAQAPATVKAVEQSCVTCGGAHSYKNCPATDGNVYQDNIQEYVSQAAAANFNQGNSNSRPPMVSNQIRPPGFPPIQNNQNRFNQNQGNNFNQNRGTNFNQNRGSNFNQGQVYQPPTNQPPVYQAPTQQMQGVSKTDFENYVKANDAVLRNMQNQGQGLQNQMTNLTEMLSKFISSNTASSSNSGTLPSQTVTNPREHVNAITTRSGKTCEGPSTPLVPTPVVSTPLKEPEQNPETSMDKVQKPSSENTAQVPPPEDHDSIFIEIPKPKAKKTIQEPNSPEPNSYQPKLPYPERMKVREKDTPSAQQSRFMKLFKQLRLEIGLKDALIEMPKFNKWLSTLLRNKEKLEEIAITTVNVECSAIILNKVPEKLKDPGKFLISCALQELDRTIALANSGASINLLPHSIYKQLRLGALKPTRMTLELANRSVTHPMGIAEDVVVRVDGFTFLADFVVVNFEPDLRVPIILGRHFLCTAKALIDLYEEKLTLRVGSDELVFYAEKSEKSKNKQFAHAISVLDFSKDEPFSGSTTNHSNALPPSSSPGKTSEILKEFADEFTLLKKVVHEENYQVYTSPLFEFDDNFTSSNKNHLFSEMDEDVENENSNVSNSNEPDLLNTPLSDKVECFDSEDNIDEIDAFLAMEVSSNFEEGYFDSEGDVTFLENLLSDDTTHNLAPEFAGELITLPSRIAREHEEYLNRMTLLCEISTSRSQENANPSLIIESLPVSLILVEDSEPVQEEIDIFLVPDDLIPPGVENDDSKDQDNGLPNLDHQDNPPSPRPPPEPPDVCLNFKPDTAMKNDEDFNQGEIVLSLNVEDVNSFTFVIWTFPPFFTYLEDSPVILSLRNEDLDRPKFSEASRVRCFVPVHSSFLSFVCNYEEELDENDDVLGEEEFKGDHFDKFPTRSKLAYHKYLMSALLPSIIVTNLIIAEGNPLNIKIMTTPLEPRSPSEINNFTGRVRGMHIFIGNFTYVSYFMIVEDISSVIDPRMSLVVLGKPFVKLSNMTYDLSLGLVKFTKGVEEIPYKMPYKIKQYDSLSNKEKENMKSVYFKNEEDKRKGVEYVTSKILGFYKECLELRPVY
ncbi:reverse transcriptase domain-containing protein [Tanacetum coccineum]|uniref:Reverse transcriptase domain-containing protein n=1 Tax=Tanacetum coccineum TaxID=301880 RepID=A0ABQ5BSP3_9ASTR